MNKKVKHKCEANVSDGWAQGCHKCGVTAKYVRDGKWYCKRHDPVAIKEREKKRDEKFNKMFEASQQRTHRREVEIAYCKNMTTNELEAGIK